MLREIVCAVNNFSSSIAVSTPFIVNGTVIGNIPNSVSLVLLSQYGHVFVLNGTEISFGPNVTDRTSAMDSVLQDLRAKLSSSSAAALPAESASLLQCLNGWRSEKYAVFGRQGERLFSCERSACGLFGVRQYGCHLNGYCQTDDGKLRMWIARRSKKKQTNPGQLDNIVGGKYHSNSLFVVNPTTNL